MHEDVAATTGKWSAWSCVLHLALKSVSRMMLGSPRGLTRRAHGVYQALLLERQPLHLMMGADGEEAM